MKVVFLRMLVYTLGIGIVFLVAVILLLAGVR